jgi:hypothetical protein
LGVFDENGPSASTVVSFFIPRRINTDGSVKRRRASLTHLATFSNDSIEPVFVRLFGQSFGNISCEDDVSRVYQGQNKRRFPHYHDNIDTVDTGLDPNPAHKDINACRRKSCI